MKILSISDIITNSSSETFCIIKSNDEEILKEIYNTLGEHFGVSSAGEGGTILNLEHKDITIDFDNWVWCLGIDNLFKPGIIKLLEPWENNCSIEFV